METTNTITVNGSVLPAKVITLSYVFRAIKDQKKLDELVAQAATKGTNHVSYEVVESEDESTDTLYRRKQEDYQVTIPDFGQLLSDATLAKFVETAVVEVLQREGQSYVNTGSQVVFDFDTIKDDLLAGRSRAAAGGAAIPAETIKSYIELLGTFMAAKGLAENAVKLVSEVVKGKFSAAKVAPLGTEGVNRIIHILEVFKTEVLDTDADLLAGLSSCHEHLLAKAEDSIKPKEVDYDSLLSFS